MKYGQISAAIQSALVILLMTAVTACERQKRGPAEVSKPIPAQQNVRAMTAARSGEDQSMVAEFGDLRLRFSEETKPQSSGPPDANRQAMWIWEWPLMKLVSGRNRPPTPEELSKTIWFRITAHEQVSTDKSTTVERSDPNAKIGERAKGFSGPFINNDLRLLEYRRTNISKVAMFYVADDKSIATPSGITMLAECGETPTVRNGGYRSCVAGGSLAPGVRYSYEFTDRLLPEWRLLNSAINQFINEIVVTRN